jgi:hypothetical protein
MIVETQEPQQNQTVGNFEVTRIPENVFYHWTQHWCFCLKKLKMIQIKMDKNETVSFNPSHVLFQNCSRIYMNIYELNMKLWLTLRKSFLFGKKLSVNITRDIIILSTQEASLHHFLKVPDFTLILYYQHTSSEECKCKH